MWINSKILDLFSLNKEEMVKLKTERDLAVDELTRTQIMSDWLRLQVNSLQMERTQLLDKAYGIKVPTPIMEKAAPVVMEAPVPENIFDDMGDEMAKKFGLPVYGN